MHVYFNYIHLIYR